MLGTVVHFDQRTGLVAIRDSNESITLAEVLGGYDIENGNIISGNLHSYGGEDFFNKTTNEYISVYVEYVGLNDRQAIEAIQRCGR